MLIALFLTVFLTASHGKAGNDKPSKRTYQLGHFCEITNLLCNLSVVYTQGTRCTVEAEGTPAALDAVDIKTDGGILSISNLHGTQPSRLPGTVTLHITAPELKSVVNRSNMSFTSNSFTADNLNISNSGAMRIKANHATCKQLNIKNSGNMEAQGSFTAQRAQLSNEGACRFSADIMVSPNGNIYLSNSGNMKYTGKMAAYISYIEDSGAGHYSTDITAKHVSITSSGNMTGDIKINGGKVNIECSGAMKANMALECENICVNSSGNSSLTLSGTADYIEFTGKGAANIDTKALNKF